MNKSAVITGALVALSSLSAFANTPPVEWFDAPATISTTDALSAMDRGTAGRGEIVLKAARPGARLVRSERRSIQKLNAEQASFYTLTDAKLSAAYGREVTTQDFDFYANFAHGFSGEHETRHWIAAVPRFARVSQLIVQPEWFGSGAGGHLQNRFVLDQPILILPQLDSDADWDQKLARPALTVPASLDLTGPTLIPGDLVFSLFVLKTETGDASWGPVPALGGEFANAYVIGTPAHFARTQTVHEYVEQYRIHVPAAELQARGKAEHEIFGAILAHAIGLSANTRETELYHLVFNSCITAALANLQAGGQGLRTINVDTFNPYEILPQLMAAGYTSEADKLPSVNELFGSARTRLRTEENAGMYDGVQTALKAGLITGPDFDNLVRDFTYFLIQDDWKAAEMKVVVDAFSHDAEHALGRLADPQATPELSDHHRAELLAWIGKLKRDPRALMFVPAILDVR